MPAARCGWNRSSSGILKKLAMASFPKELFPTTCRRSPRTGDHDRRPVGRRAGAGADDHARAAGERQGRRHGQQGAAGRARAGAVRSGPRAGPVDRLRGLGGGRHSDHRQHQPVPVGQPDRVAARHPQRHQQFHPHADGRAGLATMPTRVAEAQRLGYAEADPTMDVDGTDAAQKLAILAHLAFGARVHWQDIPRRGIDTLDLADMHYAKELGYRIKLLAVAELVPDGLELHVSPTLVQDRHAAGRSARSVQRHQRGGRRGRSGVLPRPGRRADADRFGRGGRPDRHGRRPRRPSRSARWSCGRSARRRSSARDPAKMSGRYYLRFNVEDRPGVMAEITGVLGQSWHLDRLGDPARSRRRTTTSVVPLVIMTHRTSEGDAEAAIAEIERLGSVRTAAVRMRVRD